MLSTGNPLPEQKSKAVDITVSYLMIDPDSSMLGKAINSDYFLVKKDTESPWQLYQGGQPGKSDIIGQVQGLQTLLSGLSIRYELDSTAKNQIALLIEKHHKQSPAEQQKFKRLKDMVISLDELHTSVGGFAERMQKFQKMLQALGTHVNKNKKHVSLLLEHYLNILSGKGGTIFPLHDNVLKNCSASIPATAVDSLTEDQIVEYITDSIIGLLRIVDSQMKPFNNTCKSAAGAIPWMQELLQDPHTTVDDTKVLNRLNPLQPFRTHSLDMNDFLIEPAQYIVRLKLALDAFLKSLRIFLDESVNKYPSLKHKFDDFKISIDAFTQYIAEKEKTFTSSEMVEVAHQLKIPSKGNRDFWATIIKEFAQKRLATFKDSKPETLLKPKDSKSEAMPPVIQTIITYLTALQDDIRDQDKEERIKAIQETIDKLKIIPESDRRGTSQYDQINEAICKVAAIQAHLEELYPKCNSRKIYRSDRISTATQDFLKPLKDNIAILFTALNEQLVLTSQEQIKISGTPAVPTITASPKPPEPRRPRNSSETTKDKKAQSTFPILATLRKQQQVLKAEAQELKREAQTFKEKFDKEIKETATKIEGKLEAQQTTMKNQALLAKYLEQINALEKKAAEIELKAATLEQQARVKAAAADSCQEKAASHREKATQHQQNKERHSQLKQAFENDAQDYRKKKSAKKWKYVAYVVFGLLNVGLALTGIGALLTLVSLSAYLAYSMIGFGVAFTTVNGIAYRNTANNDIELETRASKAMSSAEKMQETINDENSSIINANQSAAIQDSYVKVHAKEADQLRATAALYQESIQHLRNSANQLRVEANKLKTTLGLPIEQPAALQPTAIKIPRSASQRFLNKQPDAPKIQDSTSASLRYSPY